MAQAFDMDGLQQLRARHRRPASRFLDIGGVDVHLIDEGGGGKPLGGQPVILLLSAQWLAATAYDRFAARLCGMARVVRLDMPGHGLTGPFADGDYSAHAYARLVSAVIAGLGLARVVLVGHSHSGIAAALVALDPQNRVTGLVLATSSGMPRAATAGSSRAGAMAGDLDSAHDLAWYREKLDALLPSPHPAAWREQLDAETLACNELPGRSAETQARAAALDTSVLPAALAQLTLPGLVLWSERSTYLPPETGDRIVGLWPAAGKCHVLPGSGHLLVADAQDEVASAIAAFLGHQS